MSNTIWRNDGNVVFYIVSPQIKTLRMPAVMPTSNPATPTPMTPISLDGKTSLLHWLARNPTKHDQSQPDYLQLTALAFHWSDSYDIKVRDLSPKGGRQQDYELTLSSNFLGPGPTPQHHRTHALGFIRPVYFYPPRQADSDGECRSIIGTSWMSAGTGKPCRQKPTCE